MKNTIYPNLVSALQDSISIGIDNKFYIVDTYLAEDETLHYSNEETGDFHTSTLQELNECDNLEVLGLVPLTWSAESLWVVTGEVGLDTQAQADIVSAIDSEAAKEQWKRQMLADADWDEDMLDEIIVITAMLLASKLVCVITSQ